MRPFPETPTMADAPASLLDSGHLWLQEHVLGAPLRFRVTESGLTFGDEGAWFDPWEEPLAVRAAVASVRDRFDAVGFRREIDDATDYVFFGVATRNEGIEYDWGRLPAFLGLDVRAPDGSFLPVDRATDAFERLGLAPANSVERELPARDFHPDRYDVPASAWYDGPAAGVLVRRKDGPRALLEGPVAPTAPEPCSPAAFRDRYVTPDAIDAAADALGEGASVEAVRDRLLARLVRQHYQALEPVDEAALSRVATEPVARRLG